MSSKPNSSSSTNVEEEVDFLIVGAGPAGLSAALSLQYHTLLTAPKEAKRPKILLVDALPHGQNESRALGIIPRTLELLNEIDVNSLIPLGVKSDAMNLQSAPKTSSPGSVLVNVNFSALEGQTEYPFLLLIGQHITEAEFRRVLNDRGEKSPESAVPLLREMKMVDMQEDEREVEGARRRGFLVSFENGKSIWCQYLIGADGSRSIVRSKSQIPFEDPAAKATGFARIINKILTQHSQEHVCLADVDFEEDLGKKHRGTQKRGGITFYRRGFLLFGPLKVSGVEDEGDDSKKKFIYRIGFPIPEDEITEARSVLASNKHSVDNTTPPGEGNGANGTNYGTFVLRDEYEATQKATSYLQDKIDEGLRHIPDEPSPSDLPICPTQGTSLHIQKVIWTSMFRIRYAVADVFHKSFPPASDADAEEPHDPPNTNAAHVFLIGDAAHVHSPAGGQGMNLGIRDGLECGKAIAEYWRISTSYSLDAPTTDIFEDFSSTRRKEAIQIIEVTKRISWFATLKGGSFAAWLRDWIAWFVGRSSFLKNKFLWTLSGLGRSRE